jgi:hypothetical protein
VVYESCELVIVVIILLYTSSCASCVVVALLSGVCKHNTLMSEFNAFHAALHILKNIHGCGKIQDIMEKIDFI